MNDHKLHRFLIGGSLLLAVFLLAPYFGLHLPGQTGGKAVLRQSRPPSEISSAPRQHRLIEDALEAAPVRGQPEASPSPVRPFSEIEDLLK